MEAVAEQEQEDYKREVLKKAFEYYREGDWDSLERDCLDPNVVWHDFNPPSKGTFGGPEYGGIERVKARLQECRTTFYKIPYDREIELVLRDHVVASDKFDRHDHVCVDLYRFDEKTNKIAEMWTCVIHAVEDRIRGEQASAGLLSAGD